MTEALEYRVHGMDCADEVAILKRELGPLIGSDDRLAFDILRGKMTVLPGTTAVEPASIESAVRRTGMRAEPWSDQPPGVGELTFWQRRGRTVLTIVSGVLAACGFIAHVMTAGLVGAFGSEGLGVTQVTSPVAVALYGAAIVAGGWYVAPRAAHALRRMRPDMNLLMTVAVVGAAVIGEWFEGAVVTFLFALSLALESWSVGRARRAVDALLAIAPESAHVVAPDGTISDHAPVDVVVGAIVNVRPGERIPLDGTVRAGTSQINQAPITGESLPVEKGPGADVFAGTINGEGVLQVEVTRLAGESTLAQIIRMVGEAHSRRAPSERWVDRFAQIYTPVVLAISVALAVVPPLVVGGWSEWFYRALVLLVIGCPCALVISTPVSIVSSLAAAARNGVLVKGGAFMEAPAKLRAFAMDKTGTLTAGRPKVESVMPLPGHTREELLRAMGAIEAHSEHPLARAITAYVRESSIEIPDAVDVRALDGRGATGTIDGRTYWLGSHRYLEERGQETPEVHEQLESMSAAGRTVVAMGTDDHVCGFVTLADPVRPESRSVIAALREAGIEHVVMLTGDNRSTADRIAQQVGIEEVQAELLPADKVSAIEGLVAKLGTVAMIGDGVNDAPAMGRATIGIAMGAAGSDAAIEAADIALMSDDLSKLPWLVRHSRRTLSIIRQNVVLSLGVKAVFVVLTLSGLATLWAAIAADMGVSLLVISNALRLLRGRSEAL